MRTATPLTYRDMEALYVPHERDVLRSLIALSDAGVIERSSAVAQIDLLHGLKSMLGATILADDDPWREPPMTAVPLSSASPRAA